MQKDIHQDESLYHLEAESSYGLFRHLRLNVILLAILLLAFLVTTIWLVIKENQQKLIEHQAIELANVVSRVATSARSIYAREVVQKLKRDGYGADVESAFHKGYVPLPAQFLKLLGQHASEAQNGLYQYRLISKWNLEPNQSLKSDFHKWAWPQLEAQDTSSVAQKVDWKPIWRIENDNGVRVLRYLRADPASGSSCVSCHNAIEQTPVIQARRQAQGIAPRQWKLNQLLGAIEVSVPIGGVEDLAIEQTKVTIYIVVSIMLIGLGVIGLFIFSDFKHAKGLARKLHWHAEHDKLTGLLNRSAFDARVSKYLDDAKECDNEHALLFMDLDQFKLLNDTCGHIAGDLLLKEIATLLQSTMRTGDIVARLGGDEFGVILANCNIHNASLIADKILTAIQQYEYKFEGKVYKVGVSIGVILITSHSKDVASLMSSADMACYAAKDKGRNQVYLLTELDEIKDIRDRMEWPSRIHEAINNGQLTLAFQTAKSLHNGLRFEEYIELLIRLFDEDGTPIPTYKLIEAAERYSFIDVIDKWVTKKTFQYIQDGLLKVTDKTVIAINLSGNTISNKNFVTYVKDLFKEYPKITPQQICFEVTETAAVNNIDSANSLIASLKEIGCLFALDDFGSGLSSLMYLKNLNVDFLKIDGEFIRNITIDKVDRVMVESVVQMSKALKLPTIAEWVETKDILDLITDIGVSYAQGYYVHEPTIIEVPKYQKLRKTDSK